MRSKSKNNRIHGYGALNFGRNLSQCYLRLAERAIDEHDLKRSQRFRAPDSPAGSRAHGWGRGNAALSGPRSTSSLCFTKGNFAGTEIARSTLSGLRPLFAHCRNRQEKNKSAYEELARVRGFDVDRTWMIGNSPKSDINPALDAGQRAVFIPHERTWTLEREEIREAKGRLK